MKKKGFIFEFNNFWLYRDFRLGISLSSDNWDEFKEYYLAIGLGFWELVIGFRYK